MVGNRSSLFVKKFIIKRNSGAMKSKIQKKKITRKHNTDFDFKKNEPTQKGQKTFRDGLGRVREDPLKNGAPDFFKINRMFKREEETAEGFGSGKGSRKPFESFAIENPSGELFNRKNRADKPKNLTKKELQKKIALEEARLGRRDLPERPRKQKSRRGKANFRRLRSSFRYKKLLSVKRRFEDEDSDGNIINIKSLAGLKSFEEELKSLGQTGAQNSPKDGKTGETGLGCIREKAEGMADANKTETGLVDPNHGKQNTLAVRASSIEESGSKTLFNRLGVQNSCGDESDVTRQFGVGATGIQEAREWQEDDRNQTKIRNDQLRPVEQCFGKKNNLFVPKMLNQNVNQNPKPKAQVKTNEWLKKKITDKLPQPNFENIQNERSKNIFAENPENREIKELETGKIELSHQFGVEGMYQSPMKLKKVGLRSNFGSKKKRNLGQNENVSLNMEDWEMDIFGKLTPSKGMMRGGDGTPSKSLFGSAIKR